MADPIPDEDEALNTLIINKFLPYLTSNATTLGVPAALVTKITASTTAWTYAYTAHLNAQSVAQGATADKNYKKGALVDDMREVSNTVQANPAVTDAMKELLGITVRKKTRTPADVPTTIPFIQKIDTSTRAILRLHFVDSDTPDIKAKPAGVRCAEIREQVGGTAPTDPEAMGFLCMESRTPYRADFDAADIGKTAYFACRWINTRNQPGPWSQVYNAIVPS